MKTAVGVYETHEKAADAIKKLSTAGYPVHQITILAQGEVVAGEARIKSVSSVVVKEISIGAALGSVLGVLTGIGIFALPGVGFLFGAGALFGGFTGFEAGLLSGGIAGILTSIGIDLTGAARYQQHLNEGRFLVIVQGTPKEIEFAKSILEPQGEHFELNSH